MERHAETRQRTTLAAGLVMALLSIPVWTQATSESRPATRPVEPVVDLPVSTTVKPVATTRKQDLIVVAVAHVDPTDAPCEARTAKKHCVDADHWRVRLGRASFSYDRSGMDALVTALGRISKRSPTDGLSSQTTALRLDGDAPWGLAQKAMESCARVGLFKTEIEAKTVNGVAGRLPVWLPHDPAPAEVGDPFDDVRVIVGWDRKNARWQILLGNRPIADDADGWASLSALIGERYASEKARGRCPPLTIASGPIVPVSRIVRVIDATRAVCEAPIEFGAGPEFIRDPPTTRPR